MALALGDDPASPVGIPGGLTKPYEREWFRRGLLDADRKACSPPPSVHPARETRTAKQDPG